jgi:uncharacterized protein
MSGLRIDVADLLAHAGARRDVTISSEVADLAGSAARVTDPVEVSVSLERISDGIVVRGTVAAHWQGECSYCLRPLDESVSFHVDELFEGEPVEGETYPIEGHTIDLEQLVRDTILLELPLAPHCAEPCAPDAPVHAEQPPRDPRWAALSELEIP